MSELETHQKISTPWIDRSRFKKKLVEYGKTIELQCSEIKLILPVVEESAAWLRKWCPVDTKIIDVEFELGGNFFNIDS